MPDYFLPNPAVSACPCTCTPPPVINSATARTTDTDTAFSYTITATNSPTSYNATGLPTGLSINTTTGVISGSIITQGTYTVNLFATNAGGTGTAKLTLTVNKKYVAPLVKVIQITYGTNCGHAAAHLTDRSRSTSYAGLSLYTYVADRQCWSESEWFYYPNYRQWNADSLLFSYDTGFLTQFAGRGADFGYNTGYGGFLTMLVNVQGYLNRYGPSPINIAVSFDWFVKFDCYIWYYSRGCSRGCNAQYGCNGSIIFYISQHEYEGGPALAPVIPLTYGAFRGADHVTKGGFNIGVVFQPNGTRTLSINN